MYVFWMPITSRESEGKSGKTHKHMPVLIMYAWYIISSKKLSSTFPSIFSSTKQNSCGENVKDQKRCSSTLSFINKTSSKILWYSISVCFSSSRSIELNQSLQNEDLGLQEDNVISSFLEQVLSLYNLSIVGRDEILESLQLGWDLGGGGGGGAPASFWFAGTACI